MMRFKDWFRSMEEVSNVAGVQQSPNPTASGKAVATAVNDLTKTQGQSMISMRNPQAAQKFALKAAGDQVSKMPPVGGFIPPVAVVANQFLKQVSPRTPAIGQAPGSTTPPQNLTTI